MKGNKVGYIIVSDNLYINEYPMIKKIYDVSIPVSIEYIRHLNTWKIYLFNETFEEVNEGFAPREYLCVIDNDGNVSFK